ncbi:hypothetical protein [Promicromonospora sp. NPDC023987]
MDRSRDKGPISRGRLGNQPISLVELAGSRGIGRLALADARPLPA